LENICEKLTHVHKVVLHLVVLAHLQRVGRKKQGGVFYGRQTLSLGASDHCRVESDYCPCAADKGRGESDWHRSRCRIDYYHYSLRLG
jgi:hypothetical protein